jgi:hypothetical protein
MTNLLPDLRAERAKYGPTMTSHECVALLNAVAWKNRAAGWGLGSKTTGNRGRRSDGVECSVDGLVSRDLQFVDALIDAGSLVKPGLATPTWNEKGASTRAWVAPIDVPSVQQPPAGEQPPDVTPPPAAPSCTCSARLIALEARLDALEATEYVLAVDAAAPPVSSGRAWGHAHDVPQLRIVKK